MMNKLFAIPFMVYPMISLSLVAMPALALEEYPSQPIIRAAFDLGSGSFKLLVCEVSENHITMKFTKLIKVRLSHDLSTSIDGKLGSESLLTAIQALRELIQLAKEHGATQFSAIATAIFRQALNGKEFIQRLIEETGLDVQIISQEQEGILGLKSAIVLTPELPPTHIISLDLGAASTQLTTLSQDRYLMHGIPLGMGLITKMYSEEIKHVPFSMANPLLPSTIEEIQLFTELMESKLGPCPAWLTDKLNLPTTEVIYFDDPVWIAMTQDSVSGLEKFSKEQLWRAILALSLPSAPIDPKIKPWFIKNLAYIYAVMNHFGIQHLTIKKFSAGNTPGIMVDSSLWSKSEYCDLAIR